MAKPKQMTFADRRYHTGRGGPRIGAGRPPLSKNPPVHHVRRPPVPGWCPAHVTLRVRGLFEPTTMTGAEAPVAAHPYFVVGGEGKTLDWSRWEIDVSEPKRAYTLNHYPAVSHTIYREDFEATIPVAAGATVVVQVNDGNNRQIDNGFKGRPDRQQILEGVADTPRPGQMLRLDVVRVAARR